MYSKTTKINEIFLRTPHFFLKLVQKLKKKKPSLYGGPLWLHTIANSCQLSHLHRFSGLLLMSLMYRKEFLGILSPATSSSEENLKNRCFSPSSYSKKMRCGWYCEALVTWLRNFINWKIYSHWRHLGWASQIIHKMMDFW